MAVRAVDACPSGEQRLNAGEPCISIVLFNYLYCLAHSPNAGKIEVTSKDSKTGSQNLEIKLSGQGSGVIVKGEGGVGFKKDEANQAVRELSERIDPSLANNCKWAAQPAPAQPNRPVRQQKQSSAAGIANDISASKSRETQLRDTLAPKNINITFWTGKPKKRFQVFAVSDPLDRCYAVDMQLKFYRFRDTNSPCDLAQDPELAELQPIVPLTKNWVSRFNIHVLRDEQEEESFPGIFSSEGAYVLLKDGLPSAIVVGSQKREADSHGYWAARPLAVFAPTERGTVEAFTLGANRRSPAGRRFNYELLSRDQFNAKLKLLHAGALRSPPILITGSD